jgi:hypothetical protein
VDGDWKTVIDKKKRNLVAFNTNLIQIIPTNVNKPNLKHNLKDFEEGSNMRMKEFGPGKIMNNTLTNEKTKEEERQEIQT